MDAMEAILTRKSIRKFLPKKVPGDTIRSILEAGIRAPSGGNRQPWRFIVVTDRKKIKKFDPYAHQPWVEEAPAVIVVCANPHDTWERYDEDDQCYVLDASAAIENMLLAIHALGLGAVWCLTCSKRDIRKLLSIPAGWQIISIVPFGYYDMKDSVKAFGKTEKNTETRPRKPLNQVAFINSADVPFE